MTGIPKKEREKYQLDRNAKKCPPEGDNEK